MSSRKKRRSEGMSMGRKGLLYIVLLILSGFFIFSSVKDVVTCLDLNFRIQANTQRLEQTQEQKDELETTKKNLTNPDYLEFVARGQYHVSKDGEQVFVFPKLDE